MRGVFQRGGQYGIDYRYKGKRIRVMVSAYREHAENELRNVKSAIYKGSYEEQYGEKADMLFENFAEKYYEMHIVQNNKDHHKCWLRLQTLVRYFKGNHLSDITRHMIVTYRQERMTQVKPSTVNREMALLRSLFNRAIEWEMYKTMNPTTGIKKFAENCREKYLSEKEVETLVSHCKGMTRIMVIVGLGTGLRWGEMNTLKWKPAVKSNYIDLEKGFIYIDGSLSKSSKSRYIPLNEAVKGAILQLPRFIGSEYVFVNKRTGKPIERMYKSFYRAVKAAGLNDIHWHDLRHVFASRLAEQGVPLYEIQTLLGHSTPTMTQRYARYQPEYLRGAIDKLNLQSLKPENDKNGHSLGTRDKEENVSENVNVINLCSNVG